MLARTLVELIKRRIVAKKFCAGVTIVTTRCRLLCHDLDSGAEFFGDDLLAFYRNSDLLYTLCGVSQGSVFRSLRFVNRHVLYTSQYSYLLSFNHHPGDTQILQRIPHTNLLKARGCLHRRLHGVRTTPGQLLAVFSRTEHRILNRSKQKVA